MRSTSKIKLVRVLATRPRLLTSIGIAGLSFLLLPDWLRLSARIILAWDCGAICFLVAVGLLIGKATPGRMRRRAQMEDEGRWTILLLVIIAACISLLAIGFMLNDKKGLPASILTLHLGLAGLTVVASWLLMHTIFALHYAHGYYMSDRQDANSQQVEGLDFPQDTQPDYWDFLYFSFVIGMTCQVSDVQIMSKEMRRLALGHGILTFFFNTVILALSINLIAGQL